MSVGAPVVAADAGGTAEIITSGEDGFVVPVKDSAAIAGRVGAFLCDERLRQTIGERGLATARERFSIPVMVGRVESLFYSAMG